MLILGLTILIYCLCTGSVTRMGQHCASAAPDAKPEGRVVVAAPRWRQWTGDG
jgi:hypothetical protein